VIRSEARLTESVEVEGVDTTTTVAGVATVALAFSIPLGTPESAVLLLRQRALALLDDDAIMDDLNHLGEI
jgi:hypothetical protein